jgi:D-alanine-D-alanine ligase
MDKDMAKRLASQNGIPTPAWRVVRGADMSDPVGTVDRLVEELGLPVFVKPAELGSSVGVARADTEAQLKEGLEVAIAFGPKVIVEEAIDGREIEVAILEGPRAAAPGEIVLEAGWYDYEAKYRDETSRFVVPAALTETQTARVRELAGEVFTLLECSGLARVDFLLEEDGRGFLLNEVNTMPGFTPISGFPKMWQASGMTYAELCDELVRLALAR